MLRAICLSTLVSVLVPPTLVASPAAVSSPAHRNLVRLSLNFYSTLPSGSMILCKAQIVLDSSGSSRGTSLPAVLSPQAAGATILRGPSATCSIEIPLCWTGDLPSTAVSVRYEIDAATRPGMPIVVGRGVQAAIPIVTAGPGAQVRLSLGPIPEGSIR
jgi:hypothetical protein